MPQLSLVPTKTPAAILPENEIIRRYAADLAAESWCIDMSAHPTKALHAASNYNAVIDKFRYGFSKWAHANNVRVDSKKYYEFLRNFNERLIPHLPHVLGSSFRPVPQQFFNNAAGALLANTYVHFAPPPPASLRTPDILNDYFERVFSNEGDKKIVVQWLADIIQNPERRPMWSVVLTGVQGSGKSSIFRLLTLALGGRHTWAKSSYNDALKQFSEVLPDHLLVCFDDAPAGNDTYQKLKQAITCTSMQVELKGVQKLVHREVYARILICSNHPRPLRIEEGDRRLYCAEPSTHMVSPEETAEFFVGFNDWLEQPDTPAILYHFLMDVDLSDFVPGSTLKTETHAKMVGLSTTVLENLLADYVEDSPIFHDNALTSYLADNRFKHPEPDLVKAKMAALGYVKARRKVEGCGDKQIYVWQENCARARSLTAPEKEAIQRSCNQSF